MGAHGVPIQEWFMLDNGPPVLVFNEFRKVPSPTLSKYTLEQGKFSSYKVVIQTDNNKEIKFPIELLSDILTAKPSRYNASLYSLHIILVFSFQLSTQRPVLRLCEVDQNLIIVSLN